MCSAIDVEHQRDEEQHEAEREGRQRLGAVELLVADQQGHDLHGHGGHRLERIGGEVGGEPGGHDHDHGLADRARLIGEQEAGDDAGQRRRQITTC